MKSIYLLLIYVFCYGALQAQCPQGNITFETQQQIDDFALNYPNCTNISGNVFIGSNISSTDVTNLNGLSQLEIIQDSLTIKLNDSLNDLTGLENLITNGNLSIKYNYNLTNLTGLENLTGINGYLNIAGNNRLTSLEGLQNLEFIGGDFEIRESRLATFTGLENLQIVGGNMTVRNLGYQIDSASLSGLESLDTINGSLIIENNYDLFNLIGLENLDYIGQNLEIRRNAALENFTGLENLTTIKGNLQIGVEYFVWEDFYFPAGNPVLTSLTGLENLSTVQDDFVIARSPNLAICNITGICNYLNNGGLAQIYDNAPTCNSATEVLLMCENIIPCLTNGITFSTQQQIDSFAIHYPDCQAITGDVIIQGENPGAITSLSGLSQITYIGDKLTIQDNAALYNLNGLEQLTAIKGGLEVNNNDALLAISLPNLINLYGELIIADNESIEDLYGLENIIGFTIDNLRIVENPNLYQCSVKSICDYLFGRRNVPTTIYGNVEGSYNTGYKCGSRGEVGIQCPQYLPIELTHFQVKIENKAVLITWQTATETDNEGFEIQRSKNGTTWKKIAWQVGQGTSTVSNDYTHRDQNPHFGTSYYRLKQMDFDGTLSYSDIVKVKYTETDISIYPNPVKNTLHIADLNGNNIQHVAIFDQTGRQVISQNSIQHTIDVSALAPGMYIIKINLENGIFCKKFIVEK